MIGEVVFSRLEGSEAELWNELLVLADAFPKGWVLAGAQMVILHAMAQGVARPTISRDADVVVDVRALKPRRVTAHLAGRGFDLDHVDPFGVGHRFVRGRVVFDILSIDNMGRRADVVTIPRAHTVEVPGARSAMERLDFARVHVDARHGQVPVPDWIGALTLKSRAALAFHEDRERHVQDLALLLSLPVDITALGETVSQRERRYFRRAFDLIDERAWRAVSSAVDVRQGRAAAQLLVRPR